MQALVLLIGLAFKDEDNLSVFPLTPVEILWVIMITSSFPAMGLGAEKAEPDIVSFSSSVRGKSRPLTLHDALRCSGSRIT